MTMMLETSAVRIVACQGDTFRVVGAGFLAGTDIILTCAHVVAGALGIAETSDTCPEEPITLDFPLLAPRHWLTATVVRWVKIQSDGSGDIAVLRLESAAPSDAQAAQLVTADDYRDHPFRSRGFPDGHDDGVEAKGLLSGGESKGWVQMDNDANNFRVQQGFSGGAVWDKALDGIVGMAVAEATDVALRVGWMIPAKLLIDAWPTLGQQALPPCPYRGLDAFRVQDEDYFKGRDADRQRLIKMVHQRPLVAVIGASGSGKSSLVFAGLLPSLKKEQRWTIAPPFRPGNDPFFTLAATLLSVTDPAKSETDLMIESGKLGAALDQAELTLHQVLERIKAKVGNDHTLLIVIDQFEELFTLCSDDNKRKRFLSMLLGDLPLQQDEQRSVKLILTLRADFMGQALAYRPLADALQNADLKLGPLDLDGLRQVIEEPAKKNGVTFQDGLVDRILAHIGNEPGNLPLLEFALTRLWPSQRNRQLTHTSYESIGGVEGALAQYADQVYDSLGSDQQDLARRIFLRMIKPGQGTADTRWIATRDELGEQGWVLARRLSGLSDREVRLVVTSTSLNGQETAELAHEALIQNWTKLKIWLNADRAFQAAQVRVREALRRWQEGEQENELLLRGALLVEAKDLLEKHDHELRKTLERDYIYHSILQEAREIPRWAPRYGTIEETLAFLKQYLVSDKPELRIKSIEVLRWLSQTDAASKLVDQQLQQLAIDDPFEMVRNEATQALCERGQISLLSLKLNSQELTLQQRKQLIRSLAWVRNLPNIGDQVTQALGRYATRVRLEAARQLIITYRSQFSEIIFFMLAFVQIAFILLAPLTSLIQGLVSALQNSGTDVDSFAITVTLSIGFYMLLRKHVVDGKKMGFRTSLWIGALSAILLDTIYFIGSLLYQVIADITGRTSLPVGRALLEIISSSLGNYLPSVVGMILIAIVILRMNYRAHRVIWKLALFAFIFSALEELLAEIFVPILTNFIIVLPDLGTHYVSFSNMLNSVSSQPLLTLVYGWVLGTIATFACLFGFWVGIRSTSVLAT